MLLKQKLEKLSPLLIMFVLSMILQGCSTTAPSQIKFPPVPQTLMSPAPTLKPLANNQNQLSDLLENSAENYGKFYDLKAKFEAWQIWYTEQKSIMESLNAK